MASLLEIVDVFGEYIQCWWYLEIFALGNYKVYDCWQVLEGNYAKDFQKTFGLGLL